MSQSTTKRSWRGIRAAWVLALISALLAACGGGGGGGGGASAGAGAAPGTSTSTISSVSAGPNFRLLGSVTGLNSGQSVTLLDGGGDPLVVNADGSFAFNGQLASGASYAVTVGTQPSIEVCTVSNGTGVVGNADVSGVQVQCGPPPTFAYVLSNGHNSSASGTGGVSLYKVDPSNGALIAVAVPDVLDPGQPAGIALNPKRPVLYVVNYGANTVGTYTIDRLSGHLTALGTPVSTGKNPSSIAVNSAGTFAYVTNSGSNTIATYSIDPSSGMLTSASSVSVGSPPGSVVLNPQGNVALVTTNASGTTWSLFGWAVGVTAPTGQMLSYLINPTTGSLGSIVWTSSSVSSTMNGIAVSPSGAHGLYFASGNVVQWFNLDQSTALVSNAFQVLGLSVSYTNIPNKPVAATYDPSGQDMYVVDSGGGLFGYQYTSPAATSANAIGSSSFPTGAAPNSVTVNTAGTVVYVTNGNANTVWAYSRNAAGYLAETASSPFRTATAPVGMVID